MIVIIATLVIMSLTVISSMLLPLMIFIPVIAGLLVIQIIIIRFFRVPKRKFLSDEHAIIAPADGTIVAIENVKETEYFHDERKLVSIFMSVHNVHINWFPIKGIVKYFKYHPGKYLLARHPKSSELNERTSVVVSNGNQEILVRQIAGYVARRIICYATPGKEFRQGDELGFIRFGSRVDIYLPTDTNVTVKPGEKTTGGVTIIAKT